MTEEVYKADNVRDPISLEFKYLCQVCDSVVDFEQARVSPVHSLLLTKRCCACVCVRESLSDCSSEHSVVHMKPLHMPCMSGGRGLGQRGDMERGRTTAVSSDCHFFCILFWLFLSLPENCHPWL